MLLDRIASVDIGALGSKEAIHLEGLRITFKVRKDRDRTKNTAEIEIYNLSRDTRGKITELEDFVVLKAGYVEESGLEVVFIGNIVSVTHLVESPEVITRIEANDGDEATRASTISISVVAGASKKGALDAVLSKLGLPIKTKNILDAVKDTKFLQGFSFLGNTFDALDTISKGMGLEHSIQNNEVKIMPEGAADDTDPIRLNPDSGMVGSPERQRQIESEANKEKKPPGWKVKSLLQPKIEPGGRVALQSEALPTETFFRVDRVFHNGDTHGDDWTTEVEVSDNTAIVNPSGVGVA